MFPNTVEGKFIILKKLKKEYFIDYHNMFSSKVRTILGLAPIVTFIETNTFLSTKLNEMHNSNLLFYCIFDNLENKLIGAIEIREDLGNGMLGAWLNENYWGKGIYQEALHCTVKIFFQFSNQTYINAYVKVENIRSIKAHKKYGFKIIRKLEKNNEKFYELLIKKSTLNSMKTLK